jgi:chitinase
MRTFCNVLLIAVGILAFESCKKSQDEEPQNKPLPCVTTTAPANGVTVVPGSTITLSWNAVTGATGYDVLLAPSTSGTMTVVASNLTSTSFTYTVPTATGTTYVWGVRTKPTTTEFCQVSTFKTGSVIQAPPPFGFYVVGYFPSYRTLADIPDVKFRMVNVANYAFFSVNAAGMLNVVSPSVVPQFVAKAKANNAKPFLSINESAPGYFKNMASTPSGRTAFITDVMAKVRQFGFDGVDIDWEFPSTADGTSTTFTALMKELSDSLHTDAKYYLTAAINAGKYVGQYTNAITDEVFAYVDFFNVMAYDDFNNAVPYKHHSDYNLAVTCLNYWKITRGMPASKIVLGFPAYGRGSGNLSGTNLGSQATAYRSIIAQGGDPLKDSAVITQNSLTFTTYYNGQPTVKKKAILAKQQANGVMMWEKWQDTHEGTSLLKAACDTVGRAY